MKTLISSLIIILSIAVLVTSCSESNENSTTATATSTATDNDSTTDNTTTTDTTTSAPGIYEVTPISITTDTTPDIVFNSDQAGTITFGGTCSSSNTSAVSGNNTITLSTLGVGSYTDCTIIVTNSSGTPSNTLTILSFTIEADSTAPSVSSSSTTADNQSSISPTDNFTVTFNEEMDTSTITTNTSDTSCSGSLQVSSDSFNTCVQMSSSSPISSNSNKTYTLDPNDNLSYVTTYQIRVTTGVKDTTGNSLGYQYNSSSVSTTSIDPNRWGDIKTHPYTGYSIPNIRSVSFGNNTYVAADQSGNILVSSDASSWTLKTTNASWFFDVAFGNDIFVAVGYSQSAGGHIVRSTDDGSNWSEENPTLRSTSTNGTLYALTYAENTTSSNNDYFVTVGYSGKIARAPDNGSGFGQSQENVYPSLRETKNYLLGVAYGNQSFVAVGEDGNILRGADNGTLNVWDNMTSPTTIDLNGVTFGNNTFVGVGDNGTIVRSTDNGTSWDNVTSPTTQGLKGIGFGNSTFIAVGASGTILKSTDNGTSFSSLNRSTTLGLYGVVYGTNKFVVTGSAGTIIVER
jgi:photosystem II stability/assembly factor-like uncharacterized protein